MITYVNKVFVSNSANGGFVAYSENIEKGQFVIMDCTEGVAPNAMYPTQITDAVKKFKIGMATGKKIKDHKGEEHKEIRWSNIIVKDDIKSIAKLNYTQDTPESVEVDFSGLDSNVEQLLSEGGKRVIIRLTFKDLPTRYRKWTESYEYVTKAGDNKAAIVNGIADLITKQWKRARVEAKAEGTKLTLTAMPYDDDDTVDSISWANQVRFNVNLYYTNPAADGWESLNKMYPVGVTIEKTPGYTYAASPKLVRDREAQAMGYDGILNRGEGTWPIIKPAMETKLDGQYGAITLEFENMYRAADDIFRKTKQTVEIYAPDAAIEAMYTALTANTVTEDPLEEGKH